MYNRRPGRPEGPRRTGGEGRGTWKGKAARSAGGDRPWKGEARRPPFPKPAEEGTDASKSIVIGRQPVLEALRAGRSMERIYVQKGASGEVLPELRRLAEESHVPVNTVPVEKLDSLTRGNHQGVIGVTSPLVYADLQKTLEGILARNEVPCLVMLDGVTDVRNIGAIARTALCCGAHALVIPDKGVAALNEEAVKASAGALQHIAVCRVPSLLKAVDELHLNDIPVYATEMQAEERLQDMDFRGPCCLLLGSEGKGIQTYLSKAADRRFRIPMAPGFDSLNVSVTAGIVLFEAFRQRNP
jgi:23S rRNA (guanosine2251-2'-O)-methyltransferase